MESSGRKCWGFFVTWYNGGVIENQGQDIGKKGRYGTTK